MGNLTVAVVGANDFAKNLGKRSTASDMTFYDIKRDHTTVVFVEPTKYPERLSTLFHAVAMADAALVIVDEIGPVIGETIVMLDSVKIATGWIVLRNYITPEQMAQFTKDTVLEGYSVVDDDPVLLREMILAQAEKLVDAEPAGASCGSVPIDHHFEVKGVGPVILGRVSDGHIRRHDRVRVLPGGKEAEIRSIQKHDDDFDWASRGDRVGLALKGISAEELDRGLVLTTDASLVSKDSITSRAQIVKYWLNPLKKDTVLHVGYWMQFIPARVEEVSGEGNWRKPVLKLKLQKELAFRPGDVAVLSYLEGGKLRVVGTLALE